MKTEVSIILTILLLLGLSTASGYWYDIRNSSITPDSLIYIRYESSELEEAEHSLQYYNGIEWQLINTDTLTGTTYQAVVPFDNKNLLPLSFKITDYNNTVFNAGFIDTENPLSLKKMTLIKEYQRNNEIANHLNIAAESIVISEDRINFAITNFGGGFRVSDSLFGPFYSYTVSFWHTDKDNPEYVYALIRTVNLPPFISTGLYKIDPSDDSMELLGDISYKLNEDENTLFLSCSFADLLEDEDFAAGFEQENSLYIGSMTQKIENFGNTVTVLDQGQYHLMLFEYQSIEPFVNTIPQIKDVMYEDFVEHTKITMVYYDHEGHFPLTAELETNNNSVFYLTPETHDFSNPVVFFCNIFEEWSWAEIRLSDNNSDIIKIPVYYTNIDSREEVPDISFKLYPNPYYLSENLSHELNLDLTTSESGFFHYEIRNIKGQRLYQSHFIPIAAGSSRHIVPFDKFNSHITAGGIYLIRTTINNRTYNDKFILIK